jgi:hypothetical protein
VVEYGGTVSPGKRINLDLQGVESPGSQYEWTQVEGSPVQIDNPTEPRVSLIVPADSRRLGFLLTVSDGRGGMRRFRINVPVQAEVGPARETSVAPTPGFQAEAGDDQIGLVGHRLTLDGSRSGPGDGLLYRWLQVSGPAIGAPQQKGPYYSFRPTAPGIHRFTLIVAGAGNISEPDFVTVAVGELPAPGNRIRSATDSPSASPPDTSPLILDLISIGAALAPNGSGVSGPLAEAFETTAALLPRYPTFAALQADLVQRCNVIVPSDPAARALWNRLVLEPLTQYTVTRLAVAGLDLRSPASTQNPLSPLQRQLLDETYRSIARALRAQTSIAR